MGTAYASITSRWASTCGDERVGEWSLLPLLAAPLGEEPTVPIVDEVVNVLLALPLWIATSLARL